MTKHLAVWLDQDEARIYYVDPDRIEEDTLSAPARRLHPKHAAKLNHDGQPRASKRFLRAICRALVGAEQVLVTGPSATKHELFRFLHENDPELEPKIVGIEAITRTSDVSFLSYAQRYFKLSNPMR